MRTVLLPVSLLAALALFACEEEGGSSRADVRAGAELYAAHCVSCHGPDARGGSGPDLAEEVAEEDDADLTEVILEGEDDMAAVAVTPEEAAQIVAFLRSEFGGPVEDSGDDDGDDEDGDDEDGDDEDGDDEDGDDDQDSGDEPDDDDSGDEPDDDDSGDEPDEGDSGEGA